MLKLSQQYNIINRCNQSYVNSTFAGISDGLKREQSVRDLTDIVRDIHGMDIRIHFHGKKLGLSITLDYYNLLYEEHVAMQKGISVKA